MLKEKTKKESFFTADLELTRISVDNVRYRVINHEGAECALSHLEFKRSYFPVDDEFNMDFMLKDLPVIQKPGKDANEDDHKTYADNAAMLKKQKEYRELVNFKMVIS